LKAYFDRLRGSRDATEQGIAMLYEVKGFDPAALAEAGRRWALSDPDEQSVKLLAALTYQFDKGTPRRALCDEHQQLQRWQRVEPTKRIRLDDFSQTRRASRRPAAV